ncbi:heparan-alpha-glucosaminide N-acetyltransferase domain-containing protein [Arthrobacter sp. EH-1B-1]|uniref:Heparan-alpha-glucosaminide N-acetyltransferase domain-containing protein n=1 Tax=Arthrobacter vasquezii TaxID=2977629 RepID=A0ABT6D067_9MICC|nr:heparan-alpha-glucosaminide N-acetyltransferase domain-containing protein [Arthrobacter vasquezii]MDF9279102.1 heparan-alpha-glucosaminide N-acetyltransferase domain-containing protein [Arthrobacter vasquezii]
MAITQTPGRLSGIDAARGIALFGMMCTHVFPLYVEGTSDASWIGATFSGRSSALFALVAGIGLALLSGGSRMHDRAGISRDRRGIAARAVVIAMVGLMLGGLETNIAVILFHYGILFLMALPFIGMPLRRLCWWAAGWTLISPVAAFLLRPWVGTNINPSDLDGNPALEHFAQPATLLADILVTGYYPALQWLSYLLLGILIGRLNLRSFGVQAGLLVAGVGLAGLSKFVSAFLLGPLGGLAVLLETPQGRRYDIEAMLPVSLTGIDQTGTWWWLAVSAPHSGTPLDLMHTAGTAAAVVGLCLMATRRLQWLLLPLSAPGAITLSLYSLHIWIMSIVDQQEIPLDPAPVYWAQAAVFIAIGLLLRKLGARGPLEYVAAGASDVARSAGAVSRR